MPAIASLLQKPKHDEDGRLKGMSAAGEVSNIVQE
jgi:hypothetical protein